MKAWHYILALVIIIVIGIGGFCYVCKRNNTHITTGVTGNDIGEGYDNSAYSDIREHIESIEERERISRERLDQHHEWIGEIRTESDRIAGDNREAGRINNENKENYGEIRAGADRIKEGLGLIDGGIKQLEELCRQSRESDDIYAESNNYSENNPGYPDSSDDR